MTGIARSRAVTVKGPTVAERLAGLRRRLPTFDAFERIFYFGLLLVAAGLLQVAPWLAFAIPGAALSIVALVLKLRRP